MIAKSREAVIANIRKFKDWARENLSPDAPLVTVIQRENDELPVEEAVVKTEMICALIDSLDSTSLKKNQRI